MIAATPNRRASRRLPPRGRVKAVCRKGGLDLGRNLAAAIIDVSETGIRLALCDALAAGQETSLTLETAASGRRVQRLANVVWCATAASGGATAGLRFHKPIGFAELDYFAKL